MKRRAIWIIDEGFLVPALVSVRSFLAVLEMPVTIFFCGESGLDEAINAFLEIPGDITVTPWQTETELPRPEFRATVRNRLARMDILSRSPEDLLLMLDADILFGPGFEELMERIEKADPQSPAIWAVPDMDEPLQNFLYFRLFDAEGRRQRLHRADEEAIFAEVFGPDWNRLLGSHEFNNGMMALYRCQEVARHWKDFYMKGLVEPRVNPEDDQRPLAAALMATGTTMHVLPGSFNSRGELEGDFVAYHAFCARYRMPFCSLEAGQQPCTGFGYIAQQHWPLLPPALRAAWVRKQTGLTPYRYQSIPGFAGFWHTYQEAVNMVEQGHFVEVGTRAGKGACYLAESIALAGKDIQFETITCKARFPQSLAETEQSLQKAGVREKVCIVNENSGEAAQRYADESLDFVFLHAAASPAELRSDLELWFPKVKPGGILAGMDYSASTEPGILENGVAHAFSLEHDLYCRLDFEVFIMEKPLKKHNASHSVSPAISRPASRAVWIFDRTFAPMTWLSVSSFQHELSLPVTLFYTEQEDAPEIRTLFEQLVPDLEWIHYYPAKVAGRLEDRATVINRMARFEAVRRYSDRLLLMLDGDTLYSAGLAEAFQELEKEANSTEEALFYGVTEYSRASDATFFFKSTHKSGWKIPLTQPEKENIYAEVFGEPRTRLQAIPQYNNGIIAFRHCGHVADLWERYYFRSLEQMDTNVADDQIPLTVALHDLGVNCRELPAAWNSLGKSDGPWFGWHAWAGNWKIDAFAALYPLPPRNHIARIMQQNLAEMPSSLKAELSEALHREPVYFRTLEGAFLFADLYREMIRLAGDGWKVVETGGYPGRGTVFLAELIRISGKEISFVSLEDQGKDPDAFRRLEAGLQAVGLSEYVQLKDAKHPDFEQDFSPETLDFICLAGDNLHPEFARELSGWYQALKPGGILTGFDPTIDRSIGKGLKTITQEFSREKGISCICAGQIFRLQKPLVTEPEAVL
ncbi:MAG: class I SAM-dependent methyltransferase [Bacteroidia bacterium]|nr:class I SAM-dependent methyltransferase [Bacteroidia bacterium]